MCWRMHFSTRIYEISPPVQAYLTRVLDLLKETAVAGGRAQGLISMSGGLSGGLSPYVLLFDSDDVHSTDCDALGYADIQFTGNHVSRIDIRIARSLELHMFVAVFAHKMAFLLLKSKKDIEDEALQDDNYALYYRFAFECVEKLFGGDCTDYHRRAMDSALRKAGQYY